MLHAPQPFVLETGTCFAYPTSAGRVRNPYVSPAKEEIGFTRRIRGSKTAGRPRIVLHTVHRFETFARYLVAILRYDGDTEPAVNLFPALSILHSNTFMKKPMRRVHLVGTTRVHLKRMGVAVVGNLPVNRGLVESTFARELARSGREFANDAWTAARRVSLPAGAARACGRRRPACGVPRIALRPLVRIEVARQRASHAMTAPERVSDEPAVCR